MLVLMSMDARSAELVLESHAQDYINVIAGEVVSGSADLNAQGIRKGPQCTSRPVLFRVAKQPRDETEMRRLAMLVGMEADDTLVTRGQGDFLESTDATARIGYDSNRGRYTFYSNALEKIPLEKSDSLSLRELRRKADLLVAELVNNNEREFVFANVETDWYQTKADTTHRMSKRSFRYTRKVNGRHIVDQSAHVRITFSGDGNVCAFSIENPTLVPEQLPQMVKLSATETRLRQYAENKETALSPYRKKVPVTRVQARRGVSSYVRRTIGEKEYLVPHISFLTRNVLNTGEEYSGYLHLSLDASEVPNLESSMIEGGSR